MEGVTRSAWLGASPGPAPSLSIGVYQRKASKVTRNRGSAWLLFVFVCLSGCIVYESSGSPWRYGNNEVELIVRNGRFDGETRNLPATQRRVMPGVLV